jgi:hypothetical protein
MLYNYKLDKNANFNHSIKVPIKVILLIVKGEPFSRQKIDGFIIN